MAVITANKYHLISIGLYAKHLNNEPVVFSEEECKRFAEACLNDKTKPTTDFMDNKYVYDFSNVAFGPNDLIAYNPATKTYYSKTKEIVDILNRYFSHDQRGHVMTHQLCQYIEKLGKDLFSRNSNNQPIL